MIENGAVVWMEEGKTRRIVLAHAEEIAEIRQKHPEISQQIDRFTKDVKRILNELTAEIESIETENDRELITVLLINSIHKMTDEIFL